MTKMIINGKEILTNLGESGADAIVAGNCLPTRAMVICGFRESDREFVERCVRMGYTRVRLARVTTAVRGYYDTIAYCK
jgi:hypothetical protein